jgi:adenylate cyclase class 2
MTYEVEAKVYHADLDGLRQRLEALGAVLSAQRILERNWRYVSPALQGEYVLRLRQDSRARLTYKEGAAATTDGHLTRLELETEVGDFETMHAILEKLGFHVALIYEKYRTTYTWQGAEIVLDELPYGSFVEVEGDSTTIERVLSALGLEASPRLTASYVTLFEQVKVALNLNLRDLTFSAFDGVDVPSALFGVK